MKLEVTFWDVGQGDCSVIRLPDGRLILLDVGPRDSPLIDWLAQRPQEKIYAVVLTHNDDDHAGCFATLLEQFHSRIEHQFLLQDRPDQDSVMKRIVQTAARAKHQYGIKSYRLEATPERPQYIYSSELSVPVGIYAVHPDMIASMENQTSRRPRPNTVSAIICMMVAGKVSVIWPGDCAVSSIVESCEGLVPLMLVGPHHGAPVDRKSKDYPSHFDRLSADAVFISVGSQNSYGHPVPDYVVKHAKKGRTVCCTQLHHCDKARVSARNSVLHNHLALGVLPPRKSNAVTCRGPIVFSWDDADEDFVEDRFQAEHHRLVRESVQKPLCISPS
ncbi:MAG: internalization-related competence protein ComEC/Rec2 [Verrucomicrobiaceae bacterium]|nr:internalization-related competence protein ComEC/Rec2 [Verrucomicrobiaceae bacterium]